MAGKRGDQVRSEFYDPQIMGKVAYANNPTRNRLRMLERYYMHKLTEMACNRFEWSGFPDQENPITPRYIELALVNRGLVIFFEEKEIYGQYLTMRGAPSGEINLFDEPTSFHVQGGSGTHALSKTLGIDECVPIWANYMRVPEFPHIQLWANKLAEIDRTIEISFKNARQTKLVGVPEDMRLSAENALKQMAEGIETVFGTPELSQIAKAIETIDLESHPSKIMNLLVSKGKVWNEIMTFMGISNSNEDKKERLVADEVHINNEQVDVVKKTLLRTREQACEQINKMYNLNVSVKFNESQMAMLQGADQGISANAVPNQRDAADWNQ